MYHHDDDDGRLAAADIGGSGSGSGSGTITAADFLSKDLLRLRNDEFYEDEDERGGLMKRVIIASSAQAGRSLIGDDGYNSSHHPMSSSSTSLSSSVDEPPHHHQQLTAPQPQQQQHTALDALRDRISELTAQLKQSEADKSQLSMRTSALEVELRADKAKLESAVFARDTKARALEQERGQLRAKGEELDAAEEQIRRLDGQLVDVRLQAEHTARDLVQRNQQLEQKVQALTNDVAALGGSSSTRSVVDNLEAQLKAARESQQRLQEMRQQSEQTLWELQQRNQQLEHMVQQLRNELSLASTAAAASVNNKFNNNNTNNNNNNNNNEQMISSLEQQLSDARAALASVRQGQDKEANARQQLESQRVRERESLEQQLQAARDSLAGQQQRVKDLQQQVQQQQQQLQIQQRDLSLARTFGARSYGSHGNGGSSSNNNIAAALESQLRSAHEELAAQQRARDQMDTAMARLREQHEQTVSRMQQQLQQQQQQLQQQQLQQQQQQQHHQPDPAMMQHLLEQQDQSWQRKLNSATDAHRAVLSKAQADHAALTAQLDSLQSAHRRLRADFDDKCSEVEQLSQGQQGQQHSFAASMRSKDKHIGGLQHENSQLRLATGAMKAEIDHLNNINSDLQRKVSQIEGDARGEIDRLNTINTDLQRKLSQLEGDTRGLLRELADTKGQGKTHKSEAERLGRELNENTAVIAHLSDRLRELQAENQELKQVRECNDLRQQFLSLCYFVFVLFPPFFDYIHTFTHTHTHTAIRSRSVCGARPQRTAVARHHQAAQRAVGGARGEGDAGQGVFVRDSGLCVCVCVCVW